MADPLSIGVSVLAIVTAAIQSTTSLCAVVQRYKNRDKTLGKLYDELSDLIKILSSLKEAIDCDTPILTLLKGPISRCSQVCHDFEDAMERFGGGKSKTGLRDWAKMEFMRSDINGFIDTLAGYKSTITVGLGTITMQHSKVTNELLERYSEMIQDTAYNLEIHLQRIDEKLAGLGTSSTDGSQTTTDLQDEKAVTKQCLHICQDAMSYIEALQEQQPSLLPRANVQADTVQAQFEAQRMTSQTFNEYRDKFVETIGRLQHRLNSIVGDEGSDNDRQRSRLLEDINISQQCLEVCKQASDQVSRQKIHTVGEVLAEDDTDQVVITTLADLFDVRKVMAKNRSAQLVGSMTDESLQKLSKDRYSSRFGAMNGDFGRVQVNQPASSSFGNSGNSTGSSTRSPDQARKDKQADSDRRYNKPSANDMRRRTTEDEKVC